MDPRVTGTPEKIAKTLPPAMRCSIGWLVSHDPKNIRMAMDVDLIDGVLEYSQIGEIPSTLVEAILLLTQKRTHA